jgi:hypothetical protein
MVMNSSALLSFAWRIGTALGLAACWPLLAATANAGKKAAPESKDGEPVLMSRTGGGGWSNVKELEQAALKGNPKAQFQFGEKLRTGDGIAKDEMRGVALLEQAARAGNSAAAFRIGMLLANGESNVAKDPGRALAYFRAAAAGGEKEAFFNIGAAYGSARGVKRDYGEALGWLIVARKHGADASAEQNLRNQIKAQPKWIERGERRAGEIEQEFAGKGVLDFLPPPASLYEVAKEPVTSPTAPSLPKVEPSSSAPEIPKPMAPALPPPPMIKP